MRVHRTKKAKKKLALYQQAFGFREPYQVIVDGTFALAALRVKMHIAEQLPSYLGSRVQLFTTRCLIRELEQLGELGAKLVLRRFHVRRCQHGEDCSAAKCVLDMVGKANSHRFIIATRDPDLMAKLSKKAGVPVITIHSGRPFLLRPNAATHDALRQQSEAKLQVASHEEELLKKLNKKLPQQQGQQSSQRRKRKKKKKKGKAKAGGGAAGDGGAQRKGAATSAKQRKKAGSREGKASKQ